MSKKTLTGSKIRTNSQDVGCESTAGTPLVRITEPEQALHTPSFIAEPDEQS